MKHWFVDWQRGWKHYLGNNITLSLLSAVILKDHTSASECPFSPFITNAVYIYCNFSNGVRNLPQEE